MKNTTKISVIERKWHLIDAKDKVLGRLATQVVPLLLGKNKPYFVRNLDCGDNVVIINAKFIKITGRKLEQKKYSSYSGYPGGMKLKSLSELMEKSPDEVVKKAVYGMLPDNRLKNLWLKKLHIFPEEKHQYGSMFVDKKSNNPKKEISRKKSIKKEGDK